MAATSFEIKTGVTFCQVFSCAVICCIGLHTCVSDTVMPKSDKIRQVSATACKKNP